MTAAHGGPGRSYDPWAHADALGLTVREGRLRSCRWGEYHDADRVVILAKGMTRRGQRSVLAHEVQHADRRDVPTLFGPLHARQERRARILAACLLICPDEYAAAEDQNGPHDELIADDLDVLPMVLADWRVAVSVRPLILPPDVVAPLDARLRPVERRQTGACIRL